METQMTIKINSKEYGIDKRLEHFIEIAKPQGIAVPVSKFRFQEGDWFILWDKKNDTFFELGGAQQSLPLTVSWLKVTFATLHPLRERLDLIIMLFEVIASIRDASQDADLKKGEAGLKKNIATFLNKND